MRDALFSSPFTLIQEQKLNRYVCVKKVGAQVAVVIGKQFSNAISRSENFTSSIKISLSGLHSQRPTPR